MTGTSLLWRQQLKGGLYMVKLLTILRLTPLVKRQLQPSLVCATTFMTHADNHFLESGNSSQAHLFLALASRDAIRP